MAKLNSALVNSRTIASASLPGPRNALNLRSSLATPSSAASAACTRTTAWPWSIISSTLANPATRRPAFRVRLMASARRRPIKLSTLWGRSSGTKTERFRLRAKACWRTAAATSRRVAPIQTPRPGSRRARSGTMLPSGASTNLIRSSGPLWVRVTAHSRRGDPCVASGGTCLSSALATCLLVPAGHGLSSLGARCHGRSTLGRRGGLRRGRGSFLLGAQFFEVLGRYPARGDARRHNNVFGLLAPDLHSLEHALVADGFGILLAFALGPADELVGHRAGEVFHGFDLV